MNVAVIITCNNLERYLKDAVESLRAQTVKPNEIIIIHDGCTAPTHFNNVKSVARSFNIGVACSRDEGVKHTSSEYVLFLDADDMLSENFIEETLRKMKETKADIVYPQVLLWSYWGEVVEKRLDNKFFIPDTKLTKDKLLKRNQVVVTSLIKRSLYNYIGGFDKDLPLYEDWDFFMKAIIWGARIRSCTAYIKYRQRPNSRNRQNEKKRKEITKLIQQRYIESKKKTK